jgi:uncharacterized delta-60 repeat protein
MAGGGVSPSQSYLTLVRFNANGSLDSSFGTHGYVFTSLKGLANSIMDVVLQPNGTALPKIVVVARSSISDPPQLSLIRYNPDGSIDKSFGASKTGVVAYQPPNTTPTNPNAYRLAHGGAAGADLIVTGAGVLVAFTPNAALDTNFGGTGVVSTPQFPRLTHAASQANGKILLTFAGPISGAGVLGRYNANGTLDTSFGSGGVVSSTTFHPGSLALQADGKIVVTTGSSLARYNPDGSLDGTFGTGGIAPAFNSNSIAIAPNGGIVTGAQLNVARYLPSEPQIGSFTAGQSGAGAPVTLTAPNLADANPSSTITQVTFYYYDAFGNQVVLGTVTAPDGSGNRDLPLSMPAGSYTLSAQAEDSYGDLGDPFALNLSVH